ncbi:unnamed protein product, partial [Heterosigma akashiwo]
MQRKKPRESRAGGQTVNFPPSQAGLSLYLKPQHKQAVQRKRERAWRMRKCMTRTMKQQAPGGGRPGQSQLMFEEKDEGGMGALLVRGLYMYVLCILLLYGNRFCSTDIFYMNDVRREEGSRKVVLVNLLL